MSRQLTQLPKLICWELLKGSEKDQWVTYRDEESSTPFSVNGRKFVSFDDAKSFKEKLKYLNAKDLGGVSLYSLDTDDFRGLCYDGTKYPLTNILRKEFGISVNKIISVAIETVDW
ncbi:hypothetical protein AAG570_000836 [Ranatra chinensis]|uniref:GH18 domain-containing protein n=1 Tax=Ranatra chinensis TaxID=642074 RepID=A0ABD0ZF36_9HEMI